MVADFASQIGDATGVPDLVAEIGDYSRNRRLYNAKYTIVAVFGDYSRLVWTRLNKKFSYRRETARQLRVSF